MRVAWVVPWVWIACGGAQPQRAVLPSAAPIRAPAVAQSGVPAKPCSFRATADLPDADEGELLRTRIAAAGDSTLVEWERRGTDDVEGWTGNEPHFALAKIGAFPAGVMQEAVGVSSAVAAPPTTAAPIGGGGLETFVYGRAISWTFELREVTGSLSFKTPGTEYVPPSYVPLGGEVTSSGAFRAIAVTTGSDLDGKSVDECLDTSTNVIPLCHNWLWGPAAELAIVAFPRNGAPWIKKIPVPVPTVSGEKYEDIGPAAIAFGSTRGAYAFRYKNALWLGWIGAGPTDVSAPVEIRDGKLGAPTLAMSGDELMIVWAERVRDQDPWRLVSMRFDEAKHASGIQTLTDGFAPSLATAEDRYYLAWMNGDASRVGWIHAASFARGDEPDLSGAAPLTSMDANARDPEIAVSGRQVWIVWQTFTRARSMVRLASATCE